MQSAPQLLRDLPLFINLAQLVFYTGLALTFGGIIMRGYKGYISGYLRFAGRLAFGFLAVITGIGISWVIPYLSGVPLYMALQAFLNVIPGGIMATVVLYLALRMASYNIFNIPGMEKEMHRLEGLRDRARKVGKGEKASNKHGIRHPVRLAGLALFAVFLAIGLVGFRGLPDTMEELGLSQGDLNRMAGQIEALNEAYGDRIPGTAGEIDECMGAVSLLQNQSAIAAARPHTDPAVEAMVEDYTGEDVTGMYLIESEGESYILSVTAGKSCLSTSSAVCVCQDT